MMIIVIIIMIIIIKITIIIIIIIIIIIAYHKTVLLGIYTDCFYVEYTLLLYFKARNFDSMKISRFRGWDLKSAKLKCHKKYLFSLTSKLECLKKKSF